MVRDAIAKWLDELVLGLDQKILAGVLLKLAEDFDEKTNTSTAAELRKTYLELKRSLDAVPTFDPLDELLKR